MAIALKVPTVGESITEVTVARWLKNSGDFIKLDEVLCELESDKATFEINAESSGILTIVAQEGDTLAIGAVLANIDEQGVPATKVEEKDPIETPQAETKTSDNSYAQGYPSPAAKKILDEKEIPTSEVVGSGKDGRITKEDAIKAEKIIPTPVLEVKPVIEPVSTQRASRREKMTNLRKTLAKRLVSAKNETAMLTTFNEIDMKPVMDIRKKYKDLFKEKYEVNLGFMSFFTKAVCIALQEWPAVNAYIENEEIVYHDYCDVSIAVSAPKGLVVPVIRSAEKLSFEEIEKEILRLAGKAKNNKLSIDEMTGGTFTITNGGIFGSMLSTPIINPPQSAILGMHNIVERPVAVQGEVVIRPVMYVALSYDHRIIDGRESVGFLYRIKELIEDPTRLLLKV